jgi:uncharacterized protein (DUF2267 family)
MSATHPAVLDSAIQSTNIWLHEIMDRLGGGTDHQAAYHHLRTVLHVLRDRLGVDQTAALASQLPVLVRGIFFEGWQPRGKPLKIRHAKEFVDLVARELTHDDQEPEAITRAVLDVLSKHVSAGEVRHLKQSLPTEIRTLFSDEYHTLWF